MREEIGGRESRVGCGTEGDVVSLRGNVMYLDFLEQILKKRSSHQP